MNVVFRIFQPPSRQRQRRTIVARSSLAPLMGVAFAIALSATSRAVEVESFTEPYREVAVPSGETGVLAEVLVAEGDPVTRRQVLARLEHTVLSASLEVARAAKDATGSRRGAESELDTRLHQLESYRELHSRGNATQRELDRAEGDHLQAMARLQAVREELEVRRLEYERVKAQIARRSLESPIDGFVTRLEKEAGEFVSANDPVVMHVVQIDTLKVMFSVPMDATKDLSKGQQVPLVIGKQGMRCRGEIEFVSPIAEAQSGTVRVKVRVANPQRKIPSGAPCRWDLQQSTSPLRISQEKTTSDH